MSKAIGTSNCLQCHVRKGSIFAELTVDELQHLNFPIDNLCFSQGEFFYREADGVEFAYALRKGTVKLTKVLPNGREQIVRLLKNGDLFGFEGLMNEPVYYHSAVALTACEVCRLPLTPLRSLMEKSTGVSRAVLERWHMALRKTEELVMELGAKKAAERLATFLVRWREPDTDDADWTPLSLTRGELGAYLGLTEETVSRLLAQWKRDGIYQEKSGGYRIPSAKDLLNQACSSGACL